MKALDGTLLKVVEDFKYLGAWSESIEKDFGMRKALAWSSCHMLRKVWSSTLSQKMKVRLFVGTVERVLLYDAETWTLKNALKKKLDGCYTRMLRMALNYRARATTDQQLCGDLSPGSLKTKQRRMRVAGHCMRHREKEASKLVLCIPADGHPNRGRRRVTFIQLAIFQI